MTDLDDLPSFPPSSRTAGDTWAITESVGATALGVAASRAVETAGGNPLIRDEFATILVASARLRLPGGADALLRRVLRKCCRGRERRCSAGGDPCGRAGLKGLPAG